MGADLSRMRFDALRDHSGVVMQQGRLPLDSDWNEFVAIVDRRLRAAAADLGTPGVSEGFSGVAVVPRTTPDAFRITSSADGITIGRGRMYVDGLLAENHGTGGIVLDPLLVDSVREEDTPYAHQPYWAAPKDLPRTGTHLVYLDVWQRQVTPVQEPDPVEEAAGADTTGRTQTVWRVRVHEPDTPGIDRGTRDEGIPGWSDVIAPSAGRLTTGVVAVAAADDPRSQPPGGDCPGIENRTYRVEIHDGGPPGTATFKWSRDNGSVALRVVEVVAPDRLRPEQPGPDTALGLRENDWVEILDDHRELDEWPGAMRRITTVHDDGTVSFSPALPADLPTTTDEARRRNLRIRRWDQAGTVTSGTGAVLEDLDAAGTPGVITVRTGSVAVVLEHGITVTLDAPDGGVFRPGDHWIFTAHTAPGPATAAVENLDEAPPLGVRHHYARLAVVTFPSATYDCRTLWPDAGHCGHRTVCVTPQSHASGVLTVQAAVDSVAEDGGTVCLAQGVYHLGEEPVRIRQARSVRVQGQGPGTLLVAERGGFDISLSAFVTLEDFALISSGHRPGIKASITVEVTVRRLTVLMVGGGEGSDQGPAAIQLTNASLRTRIQDCDITGRVGIEGREYLDDEGGGIRAHLLTADLEISGNLLMCCWSGVQFHGSAAHVLRNTIRGNTVVFARGTGLRLLGALSPWASFDITDNHVQSRGIGIEVGASGYSVRDNTVTGNPDPKTESGHGIAMRSGVSGVLRGTTRISGNRISRVGGVGILLPVPTGDLDVSHNTIEGVGEGGIVVTERGRVADAVIVANTLRDIVTHRWGETVGTNGIQVVGATRALVGSNTVRDLTTEFDEGGDGGQVREGGSPDRRTGVAVLACRESRVHGNTVEGIGRAEPGEDDRCLGIHVSVFARTTIEGNVCRRVPEDVDDDGHTPWSGLLVGDDPGDAPGGAPRDDYGNPGTPDIRTGHIGPYVSVVGDRVSYLVGRHTAFAHASRDVSAIVSANTFTGAAQHPAARIDVAGDAVVSANQFRQHGDSDPAALIVRATTATVTANRARGGLPSIHLDVDPRWLAVLGNITSGDIDPEGDIDPKWLKLNVKGVL